MSFWITLPHEWKLQDVQAALNVVITVISGLGIFALTRFSWQLGAWSVVRKRTTSVPSLLTLNTLGEVLESVLFLKLDVLFHSKLFAQGVAVIFFTAMTLLSGPIARYSTQTTSAIVVANVSGLLAGRTDNSMPDDQVTWNLTATSLNRAHFPHDQMLDFVPDTSYDWVYQPQEWNNSWTLDCNHVDQTPIDITLTSNCTTFVSKFGRETVRNELFPQGPGSEAFYVAHGDYYLNTTYVQDLLYFMYAANYSDYEEDSDTYRTVDIAVGSFHLHGVARNESGRSGDSCDYGEGPVESAYYTRLSCQLKRNPIEMIEDPKWVSYPDTGDVDGIPFAFASHWLARFKRQAIAGSNIDVITPLELQRFFQTFIFAKDTQEIRPVIRPLSVRVPAVQVASLFIAIFAFLLLLIMITLLLYGSFLFWHRIALETVPQSKLDWLLHSLGPNQNRMSGHRERVISFDSAKYEADQWQRFSSPPVQTQQVFYEPPKMDGIQVWAPRS